MIGVISKEIEVNAVQEFFQLFKTPWEFFAPGRDYDVIIASSGYTPENVNAKALIIYSSASILWDREREISHQNSGESNSNFLEWGNTEFPVYCNVSAFQQDGMSFLQSKGGLGPVGLQFSDSTRSVFRIGYDLFQEVSFLLSKGQPPENSCIPTMEIHISVLRDCLLRAGISFVEVPPVPAGYDFMACLTHDVDFIGIRDHKFDRTMWGFVWRALFTSLLDAVKGRLPWSKLRRNWKAASSLPFVYLGLLEDFWLEFDCYEQIEKGLGSTFFFIPFKNRAGVTGSGPAPPHRAAKYDLGEVEQQVRDLAAHGCEIGLHGIDAWDNAEKAEAEMNRVREVSGQSEVGARMHWLYFSESSPRILDQAGVVYDSTFGYNDAVGFRAGTSQVFCFADTREILELPLNIQDTALFYPSRMGLRETDAIDLCRELMQSVQTFGGVLTFNWHTRSLSPERLWGDFYAAVLAELKKHRVWFSRGRDIVAWFKSRRALCFEDVRIGEESVQVKFAQALPNGLPFFVLRLHDPRLKHPLDLSLLDLAADYHEVPLHVSELWDSSREHYH